MTCLRASLPSSFRRAIIVAFGLVAVLSYAPSELSAARATAENGRAEAEDAATLADKIIREHHLLTPKQIECMTLMERDDSTEAIAKVGVYDRHDERCGGDPEITHRLFDLEIDRKTGAAQWDNNFPDMEMRPVPDGATMPEVE